MSNFVEYTLKTDQLNPETKSIWNNITIERATQPNDVIWINFGLTKTQKLVRRLITIIAAVILIIASFWAVTGLSWG